MNLFEKFIELLQTPVSNRPESFGVYHFVCLGITILITVLLCIFFRDAKEKVFRRIIMIFWIIIVVLEIGKQLIYSFKFNEDGMYYYYTLQVFPYQLCSTPFYVFPIVVFAKEGKFRDYAISFTSLFILIGGLIVMIYPNDVFGGDFEFIFLQTMVHHGTQVIIGIYCLCYTRKQNKLLWFLKSLPYFVVLCALAVVLNEVIFLITPRFINLWNISSHFACGLPILSTVYAAVPYVVFLLAFVVGFTFLAFLVNSIALGIIKLTQLKHEKN